MQYPSDLEASRILQRKSSMLSAQVGTSSTGTVIAAFFLTVMLHDQMPAVVIGGWFLLVSILNVSRIWLIRRHQERGQADSLLSLRQCSAATVLNGALWGVMFLWLATTLPHQQLAFPILVLAAMVAGTTLMYNTHFNAFLNFAVPALLPPSLVLLLSGDGEKLVMGALMLGWFLLMQSFSAQLSWLMRSVSRYETENIVLLRDLEYQREHSERLCEELRLKSEIIERLAHQQRVRESAPPVAVKTSPIHPKMA